MYSGPMAQRRPRTALRLSVNVGRLARQLSRPCNGSFGTGWMSCVGPVHTRPTSRPCACCRERAASDSARALCPPRRPCRRPGSHPTRSPSSAAKGCGKVVLYGFDVAGSSDLIRPATHVALPGVFLHAMALDNLLTWGEHYKATAVWVAGYRVPAKYISSTYICAAFLTVFVLFFLARYRVEDRPTPLGVILRSVTAWHTLPAVCLLLGGLYSLYLDLAPINWLAIVGFAAVVPSAIEWMSSTVERANLAAAPMALGLRHRRARLSAVARRVGQRVLSTAGRLRCGTR